MKRLAAWLNLAALIFAALGVFQGAAAWWSAGMLIQTIQVAVLWRLAK